MSDQYPQVRVWHDDKWTMILVHNGVDVSTVSLTRAQAASVRQQLVPPEAKATWDSHGDGGEAERLHGMKAGHLLSEADAHDLEVVLQDWNDEMGDSANSYHDGYLAALRDIGGDELVNAQNRVQESLVARGVRQLKKKLAECADKIDGEVHD